MFDCYFTLQHSLTKRPIFDSFSLILGIIMSATEMGQIGSSLLLTYYGGQGHRPKWIAWGMVLFAVSSFTCSLPHFIYGRQLIQANDLTGIIRYFSYITLEDVQLKFLIKVRESFYTNKFQGT